MTATIMVLAVERKRSVGGILSVMVLISMTSFMAAGPTDCPPAAADVGSAVSSLSAVLDSQKAKLSQRQHLEALFHR